MIANSEEICVKDSSKVRKGLFIAIEGIDGAGKTTQIQLLKKSLEDHGLKVILTREPTEGKWGMKIRKLYNASEREKVTPDEEADYFVFDREQDVETLIQPALNDGTVVLIDRYFYSNLAYQGARGASLERIREMNSHFPIPDLVFLIDIDPETGIKRIENNRGEAPNAFEKKEVLRKVREIFISLPDKNIVLIDGKQSPEMILRQMFNNVLTYIKRLED